jgi:glycine cleavage system T protein (aminomethyltransferase)
MTEPGGDVPQLRRSPLDARHRALGAKMADFGGWSMPIEYPGGGVMKEHAAVREAVGVFDVSHLGKVRVTGPSAAEFVNACLTNDLGRISPGQAQYTLCCDDASGGVVDDLIAYLRGEDEVFLVPNAANTAEVARRLSAAAPDEIVVADEHEQHAVLAVQGPRSTDLLQALGLPADHGYMSFVDAVWPAGDGQPLVICRTGYTGEHGYELLPRWTDAGRLWDALLEAGDDLGVRPCGLGARDTLRTEMGYPLHGHELTLQITPAQARCGWAVGWKKPQFWGKAVLTAERETGVPRLLLGLEALDRGIPRPGMTVRAADAEAGVVTSGTFSPTRRIGIGLAMLDRRVGEGDEVEVDVRGRVQRFRVTKPPFVKDSTR